MSTVLITHPACLDHFMGPHHPESPHRLRAVLAALDGPDFSALLRENAREATLKELSRAHPEEYVNEILAIRPAPGQGVALDADTIMSAGSAEAALRAAGGACAAVDAVLSGRADTAFAAIRPPGHHAEPDRAMGFCLFNNAAIAALHARASWGLQRIAVLDFDVHHGNGTQTMFSGDANLFYASSHQSPCYPGTGHAREQGVAGNIVNAPLPPGTDSAAFRAAWTQIILPALAAFAPELIIISAGFDAHVADPLAQLNVQTADYAWLTSEILRIADTHAKGRVASVLEGGYDLAALADAAAAHVRALMRT